MTCMNGKRGLLRAVALGSVLLLVVTGCKSDKGVGGVRQALVGKDGPVTVSAANTIVNGYAALAEDADATANTLTVTDIGDFATGGLPALAVGDLVLIVQMAGATINNPADPADPTYGNVTSLNNAGNYELAGVADISGNAITLGCPLKKSYTGVSVTDAGVPAAGAQVIRVPQYTTLTIAGTGSITAPAWDGTVGGVVAVQAATTLQLDGTIDANATGFRGGAIHTGAAAAATDLLTYRSTDPNEGAEKGESIAGWPQDPTFAYRYGRGAPANGGGGGNWHNAGGGGGANAAANLTWTGQGVMLSTVLGGTGAWPRDPGYVGGYSNSSGGGRGGYTFSATNQDATLASGAPGAAAWGGNNRRERGGLGGHPLASSTGGASARLFLGGGGGAGDGNNTFTGPGGRGGGLVFVIAGTVQGAGTIRANGANGGAANSGAAVSGDAPGGGGGGGTVVVHAGALSGIAVEANGGLGGSQHLAGVPEAEGPGGGGGGGFVALSGGTPASVSANGGLGGTTDSPGLTEFPSNGATAGHAGVSDGSAASILFCTDAVAPVATIATHPTNPTNVAAGPFTFTSTEGAVTFECSLDGADYAPCPAAYTTPALPNGPHTISVRATDLSGNVGAPDTFAWIVDLVAPDTTIVTYPADPSGSRTGDFTFTSNESGEQIITFECRIDGGTFAPCTASYTTGALADGSHTLQVRARDAAGNVDATPDTYTWVVHALGLDAGVDAAGEDAATDGGATDVALIVEDATGPVDTGPGLDSAVDGPGTVVFLDAGRDVAAVDLAANRDVPVGNLDARPAASDADALGLEDAISDASGPEARVPDAQVVVVVDARPASDAGATPDLAIVLPADAEGPPPVADAAVPVVPVPDAAPGGMPRIMGSGFCAVNPMRDSAPGLFTFFLVGAFGLLLRRRRR